MTAAPATETNPLVEPFALPPFNSITPSCVTPGIRELLARYRADVAAHEVALGAPGAVHTWASVVVPTYRFEHQLGAAWGAVSHLLGVKNSDDLRTAHEECQAEVIQAVTLLKQSKVFYDALLAIRDGPEAASLDGPETRVLQTMIRDAELAGVALVGEKKERFNAILEESAALSTKFSNNVLDATKAYRLDLTDKADVAGLPESALEQLAAAARDGDAGVKDATAADGPWRVGLAPNLVVPFLTHAKVRSLREKVYRAYVTRASSGEWDNCPIIDKLLVLRKEKAELLGFTNYSEFVLETKMAESPAAVKELLEDLLQKSYAIGVKEFEELEAFAKKSGGAEGGLKNWDTTFWAERMREEKYDFSEEALRNYFPLDSVLEGLFGIVHRLFKVKVVEVAKGAAGDVERWHEDVKFFNLHDESGKRIASLFLDPYARTGLKRGGAWMDNAKDRSKVLRDPDGSVKLPVAYLVCNGSPPVDGKPSLLTFRDVETLLHEAGHGLQHVLSNVDTDGVTGINNIEWDAVETASQFNEHWAYHKSTLLGFAKHWETKEVLPGDLYEKIVASRTYRGASAMLRQLYFAMTDLELHSAYVPGDSSNTPFDVMRKVGERTNVLPALPEDRFLCAFSHIFSGGYSSAYYSYKWAEILSSDCFEAFEEAGLEDEAALATVGEKYRNTILGMGGSKPAMEVFVAFKGRKPSTAALLRHSGLVPQKS